MFLTLLSLFCSTASITERWGGSNRRKQTSVLKGATDYIEGVTSNEDQRSLHYYLKTGINLASEILAGAQNKYYKLGGIRDVYTETKSEQNLHWCQRGLTEPHVPQTKESELSNSSTLPIFTYQALYKFNNLAWHLTTPPKTTATQWVIGEAEDVTLQDLSSIPRLVTLCDTPRLIINSFLLCCSHTISICCKGKTRAGCEKCTHNPLLIRDSELQKHTSRVYKAKYHTFFHITAIVLWIP